jgi:hypothetical protein
LNSTFYNSTYVIWSKIVKLKKNMFVYSSEAKSGNFFTNVIQPEMINTLRVVLFHPVSSFAVQDIKLAVFVHYTNAIRTKDEEKLKLKLFPCEKERKDYCPCSQLKIMSSSPGKNFSHSPGLQKSVTEVCLFARNLFGLFTHQNR